MYTICKNNDFAIFSHIASWIVQQCTISFQINYSKNGRDARDVFGILERWKHFIIKLEFLHIEAREQKYLWSTTYGYIWNSFVGKLNFSFQGFFFEDANEIIRSLDDDAFVTDDCNGWNLRTQWCMYTVNTYFEKIKKYLEGCVFGDFIYLIIRVLAYSIYGYLFRILVR